MLKACLFAIDKYFADHDVRLPVMVSGTIFENGRTLSAQTVEAFWTSVSHFDMLSVGLNCAVGVEHHAALCREPCRPLAAEPVSCYPNAGLPDGFGGFTGSTGTDGPSSWRVRPQRLGQPGRRLLRHHAGVDLRHRSGRRRGCRRDGRPSRPAGRASAARKSLVIRPETNFIMIGERTNITGSRKFARLIKDGNFEAALAVAREQVGSRAPTSSTSTWTTT